MSTSRRGQSPILDGYLDELDAATAHLPADEAYEIRDSIAAHIADATRGTSRVDDDEARRIVRDLGPVSSIVAATQAAAASPVQVTEPTGHMGYVAAACGVAALVLFPLIPVSVVLGLAALVLGIIALRRRQQRAAAIAGVALGAIAGIVIPLALLGTYAADEGGSSSGSSSSVVTSYPASPAYDTP